jgi:hypothetical protein
MDPDNSQKYIYIIDAKEIDVEEIEAGITEALMFYMDAQGHILVIRHANSAHNDPINIQYDRLDPFVTPLGVTQALCAGSYNFKCQHPEGGYYSSLGEFLKEKKIIPACSFLQRTQHTCLLLLQGSGVTLSDPILKSLQYLNNQAQLRFISTGKDTSLFENYSPLKDKDPNITSIVDRIKNEIELQKAIKSLSLYQYLKPETPNSMKMDTQVKNYQNDSMVKLQRLIPPTYIFFGGRTRKGKTRRHRTRKTR